MDEGGLPSPGQESRLMRSVVADPLEDGGIAGFGSRLRRGTITAEAATEAYLARIDALDGALGAYECVAADDARRQARVVDALLRSRIDLGPLMGVPVAIKDLFAVDGMPITAGSNLDVSDIVGDEGCFVRRLKRAGCVILGKLKTVEFALGSTGVNYRRGSPRNPWDPALHRLAAGSSSGSGVAMAAGLCGFAIGTDTGGSVRGPAAFCGVVGVKATAGAWPMDGIFPASETFDSIGPLTRSAEDAALVMAALLDAALPPPAPIAGMRLGKLSGFFEKADARVRGCVEAALGALAKAGADIVEVDQLDIAELSETSLHFPTIARAEFIARFGRERFLAGRDDMNPDIASRASAGLSIPADAYVRALHRHRELQAVGNRMMAGVDAWIAPTKWHLPPPCPANWRDLDGDRELDEHCSGPTRAVNVLGMCAISLPVQQYGAPLPVGMQVICPSSAELRLLAIARSIERVIGRPSIPDLRSFLRASSEDHESKTPESGEKST
jgi:aspartyl-tRNA(Asn)/glutamyl-tRNA(Gln) amidotransferase subunit A